MSQEIKMGKFLSFNTSVQASLKNSIKQQSQTDLSQRDKSQKSRDIDRTCQIISSCNLLFEDVDRKQKANDSFYKVKKRRDEFQKLKNKVGHLEASTIDTARLNKIFEMERADPEREQKAEISRIIKEEDQVMQQYSAMMK
jgi:hypothetical protein